MDSRFAPLPLPLRLHPGDDLRRALEAAVAAQDCKAAFVVAGIGSLRPALIRLAGATQLKCLEGDVELLTLSGSVAASGSHLHLTVAGSEGQVLGGHAAYGCTVRNCAVDSTNFAVERAPDAVTGYDELVPRQRLT